MPTLIKIKLECLFNISKVDFIAKNTARDERGHYIMIKGSFQHRVHNVYVPNNRALKYTKPKLIEL